MGNTEENRLMPEAWQDGPRYGSPSTFMQIPGSRDLSKADVAIVGLPLDLGYHHPVGGKVRAAGDTYCVHARWAARAGSRRS